MSSLIVHLHYCNPKGSAKTGQLHILILYFLFPFDTPLMGCKTCHFLSLHRFLANMGLMSSPMTSVILTVPFHVQGTPPLIA